MNRGSSETPTWAVRRARVRAKVSNVRRHEGPLIELPLTARQAQLFRFVVAYLLSHGMPPTYPEMMEHLLCSSPNAVRGLLDKIASRGLIEVLEGEARGIRLVGAGLKLAYDDTPEGRRLKEALKEQEEATPS